MKLVHTKKNVVHPAEVSAANLKPPHCIAETQSLQKIARQFPVNQVQGRHGDAVSQELWLGGMLPLSGRTQPHICLNQQSRLVKVKHSVQAPLSPMVRHIWKILSPHTSCSVASIRGKVYQIAMKTARAYYMPNASCANCAIQHCEYFHRWYP